VRSEGGEAGVRSERGVAIAGRRSAIANEHQRSRLHISLIGPFSTQKVDLETYIYEMELEYVDIELNALELLWWSATAGLVLFYWKFP